MNERFHYRRAFRLGRRLLPYPGFWAKLTGATVPGASIAGKEACLSQPETISFTPSGDFMAVGNARSNSVTFYAREGDAGTDYSQTPSYVLTDSEILRYIHDVAFSPDGRMMATAARDSSIVAIYIRKDDDSGEFSANPRWVIRGEESMVVYPGGLAFHPSGSWLVVANRGKVSGLTMYRVPNVDPDEEMSLKPFQNISEATVAESDLAAPHDVQFSPDGKYLICTHKQFFKHEDPPRQSGVAVYRCQEIPTVGVIAPPVEIDYFGYVCVHSVDTHPGGKIVAVTDEANVRIYQQNGDGKKLNEVSQIRFPFNVLKGPKGVAFTPRGNRIAACTEMDDVLFYTPEDADRDARGISCQGWKPA